MITRRNLLLVFGAIAAPLSAYAQPMVKVWRVGFLSARHLDFVDTDHYYGPFRQGMRELGYIEGKNLVIEWRSAEGKPERLPGLAAELVNLKVDVIVAGGVLAIRAVQKATTTLPIIFAGSGNPVGDNFVKSLARPGGNITGLSNIVTDIAPKLLEMLITMVPKLSRMAVLENPDNPAPGIMRGILTAAQRTNIRILPMHASTVSDIEQAFAAMARDKAGAVMVFRDPFLNQQTRLIAELAARNKLPAIGGIREFADTGGLMSYGSSLTEQYRSVAVYVDKIIRGANPADLPVEQPTKFDLVINGKTAKALGLTIPYALRISATEVIE